MFNLKIVSPTEVYDELEVKSLTLPSTDGQRTILPNHMPLVLPLEVGVMYYKVNDKNDNFFLSEGLFTFEENQGTLLVNTIESEEEIDFNRAERARQRAVERLQTAKDVNEMKRAEFALQRSLTRLSLKK